MGMFLCIEELRFHDILPENIVIELLHYARDRGQEREVGDEGDIWLARGTT